MNFWVAFFAEDEQFEEDKTQVVKEIAELKLQVCQWMAVETMYSVYEVIAIVT